MTASDALMKPSFDNLPTGHDINRVKKHPKFKM